MTDTEISQQLAVAIGWPAKKVSLKMVAGQCMVNYDRQYWRMFDYRRPDTIWPIAERFNCFPVIIGPEWNAICASGNYSSSYADTAAKAVALAVIKAHEGAKE